MATASKSPARLDSAQRAWLKKMGVALDAPVGDGISTAGASDGAPGAATAASTASDGKKNKREVTTGLDPIRPEPQRDEPQPQPQPPAPGKRPLLKRGAKGQAVKDMQGLLKKHGATINDDGDFGPKTEAAVKAFQKSKGLHPDGIVGEKTWGALGGGGVPAAAPNAAPVAGDASGAAKSGGSGRAPSSPTTTPVQEQVKSSPGDKGDETIDGFEEYAVDVNDIHDPQAQAKLRALAKRIVASHETSQRIFAVEVHGHADFDLRLQSDPKKREQNEMEVSRDRAEHALEILVKIIANEEKRPDLAKLIDQNSKKLTKHFGSEHRIHAPAKSESEMKENRRVEFFLKVSSSPPAPPTPPPPPPKPEVRTKFRMRVLSGQIIIAGTPTAATLATGMTTRTSVKIEVVNIDKKEQAVFEVTSTGKTLPPVGLLPGVQLFSLYNVTAGPPVEFNGLENEFLQSFDGNCLVGRNSGVEGVGSGGNFFFDFENLRGKTRPFPVEAKAGTIGGTPQFVVGILPLSGSCKMLGNPSRAP